MGVDRYELTVVAKEIPDSRRIWIEVQFARDGKLRCFAQTLENPVHPNEVAWAFFRLYRQIKEDGL